MSGSDGGPSSGGSGAVTVVNATGDTSVDALLWGWKWSSTNITFSFPTATTDFDNDGYSQINGFSALNATQRAAVRTILDQIETFANLTFTETTAENARFRFAEASSVEYTTDTDLATGGGLRTIKTAEANPPEAAYAGTAPYKPSFAQGDSWYNPNNYDNPIIGQYAYTDGFMHEIGHNLGMKHGHGTQDGHGTTFPALPYAENGHEYSVMTYSDFPGDTDPLINASESPTSYMMNDIATLQYLYGANFGHNSGNTTYAWNATTGQESINGVAQFVPHSSYVLTTIWDGGGTDTYDFSNFSADLSVDLTPGSWTKLSNALLADLGAVNARANIANARLYNGDTRSLIENAWGGSGEDTIQGNQAANELRGNNADDVLLGMTGRDTLSGGEGQDTLKGGGGADLLVGGNGIDVADYSGATAALRAVLGGTGTAGEALGDTIASVENLIGSKFNDTLEGDAAANELSGKGGADVLRGGLGPDTLNGGTGIDTASYTTSSEAVSVSLLSGSASGGHAEGDQLISIENLAGSAYRDTLTGDAGANRLSGNAGGDLLKGSGGADVLDGGAGDDTADYSYSSAAVRVDLGAQSASGGDAGGDTLVSIEAVLGGSGNDELGGDGNANRLVGGAGADTLKGGGGADVLDGGSGNDKMQGGAGNDLFLVSDAGDEATEEANAGYDIVRSTVSFSLGANIERLELLGTGNLTASGSSGDNIIAGTEGDNRLNGEAGADSLYADDGADTLDGGTGADRLLGGDGNDLYLVDDAADRVVEGRGEGLDTVRAIVTHSLAANVENLVLFSLAPTAMNGTGNVLANAITGTDGNNLLNGLDGADTLAGSGGNDTLKGGGGADSLNGGLGNDYFVVDDAGDRIAGTRDDGNDTVESGISWTLGASQEALTLTGFLSTRGVGNGSDNVITGSIGNNTLDGGGGNDSLAGGEGADSINGGAGADTMNGGAGDDAYIVDSTGDRVVETLADIGGPDPGGEDGDPADGGIDLVRSSVTFTLGVNLENLTLTGGGAIGGTGNGLANLMTGNGAANRLTAYAGNDVLDGGAGADTLDGGPGADTMTGGSEADSFLYATALTRLDGVDRIRDFTPGVDHIVFENAFFTGLPTTGTLADALFGFGATASLPGQRILYESATGLLRYDADGTGGASTPVTLAQLETNLAMTASDFIVI